MEGKKEEILDAVDAKETAVAQEAAPETEANEADENKEEENEVTETTKEQESLDKANELYHKLATVCDEANIEPLAVLNASFRLAMSAINQYKSFFTEQDLRLQLAMNLLHEAHRENHAFGSALVKANTEGNAKGQCACGCEKEKTDGIAVEAAEGDMKPADEVETEPSEGEAAAE